MRAQNEPPKVSTGEADLDAAMNELISTLSQDPDGDVVKRVRALIELCVRCDADELDDLVAAVRWTGRRPH